MRKVTLRFPTKAATDLGVVSARFFRNNESLEVLQSFAAGDAVTQVVRIRRRNALPPNAVIGTTMIDRVNHRSEMSLQIDAELVAAVQFFNVGLVNQGFVVESSEGSAITWTIIFSRGEVTGSVVLQTQGDVSQAVAGVNGT